MLSELIKCITHKLKLNLSGESIKKLQIIHRDGISVSLPMAFVAGTHLAEGQEWCFVNIKKSKVSKMSEPIGRQFTRE